MELSLMIAALSLGLAGSFHCAGMCGPIALAIPLNNASWISRAKGSFIYNIGRAITYLIMGAIFGLISTGFVMAGFQKWVSVIMGSIMIISVLFPSLYKNKFDFERSTFSLIGKLKLKLGNLLRNRSLGSLLLIGILNGLLPCGLVYMALTGAMASGSVISGAMFMFIFGLGTLPMLFFISILGNTINLQLRKKMTRMIPAIVIIIGTLFILRGLGLGIPYISPSDDKLVIHQNTETKMNHCCSH